VCEGAREVRRAWARDRVHEVHYAIARMGGVHERARDVSACELAVALHMRLSNRFACATLRPYPEPKSRTRNQSGPRTQTPNPKLV
jgi:hypothetical protein